MSEAKYSVSELLEIVKYARKTGVVQLELGEVKFYFDPNHEAKRRRRRGKDSPELEQERNLQKNKQISEERLAQLRLEDPLQYEELMLAGELTKDGTEDD